MQISLVRKGIVFAVILLFMGTSVVSSAIDGNKNVDESRENSELELLNSNTEIISFFHGSAEDVNTKGLVYNKPIEIYTGYWALYIIGFKSPRSGLLDIFFEINPDNYVKTSRFIGIVYESQPNRHYLVYGIALGDIEWS